MRKTIIKNFTIPALILVVAGFAAHAAEPVSSESDKEPLVPADLGPMKYDAGGTLPCSVDSAAYDQACGFRMVLKPGGAAEIWISNIAYNDQVVYRVLYFAKDEVTTRGDDSLDYSRNSDNWLVNANGREFYKIPDAVIVGG